MFSRFIPIHFEDPGFGEHVTIGGVMNSTGFELDAVKKIAVNESFKRSMKMVDGMKAGMNIQQPTNWDDIVGTNGVGGHKEFVATKKVKNEGVAFNS